MSQVTSAVPLNAPGAGACAAGFAGAGVGAAAAAGARAGLGGAAAPALSSSRRIGDPFETLSPILLRNSLTIPPSGGGISTVGLSDLTLVREGSFFHPSPGVS